MNCTYPVNLIQSIGLKNNGADNSGSGSSLHGDGDLTVPEVELGLDGGSITLLVDGEHGTIGAGGDLAGGGLPLIHSGALGEVEVNGRLGGTLISRASLLERVAVGVGLRRGQRSNGREGHGGVLEDRRHGEIEQR